MTSAESDLPLEQVRRQIGLTDLEELTAGKQSRVVRGTTTNDRRVLVKLTDARFADTVALAARMDVVVDVAAEFPSVVAPMRVGDELVLDLGEWLMTLWPFIDGDPVDNSRGADVRLMGSTLAQLHRAMASITAVDLPTVAALRSPTAPDRAPDWQLVHGDFSDRNLVGVPDGRLRILDFDDCGLGPVEYDLANSLYMVFFDAEVNEAPEMYERFRPWFLDGYSKSARRAISEDDVDALIRVRIEALGEWLENLNSAPIGIRTSSPEWIRTLRAFVASQQSSL